MNVDRTRTCLTDGQPDLVEQLLVHPRTPGDRERDEPRRPHVGRERREADLDGRHVAGQSVAARASSTVAWIGKTLVRPVMRKILRMRSWVQTRRNEPSCARTRLRPPTR